MKAFKAIFLLVFVSGMLCSFKGKTQAVKNVLNDVNIEITKFGTNDPPIVLTGGYQVTIESSNGNFLLTVSFKLEDDHELMSFEGPNRFLALNIRDTEGNIIVRDELAVLTRSGNLKFTFHINGAGNRLPVGWINK